jgi:hypothetical protein
MGPHAGTAPSGDKPSRRVAVGDVRCGNLKRVASAVGEGSTAIALVHQALKE